MISFKEDYFFQSDPETTADYAESLRRKLPFTGEKMLMFAVLEEAIDCYKQNLFAKDRKAHNLFVETEEWILARGDDALFSFENVCDALGLDANYLRAGLRRWKEQQLAQPKGTTSKPGALKPRRRRRVA